MNYLCLQENEYDCGFACVKMLLAKVHKNRHFLFLKGNLSKSKYSMLDLKEIARKYNCYLEGVEIVDLEELFKHKNSIILIERDKKNHFVVFNRKVRNKIIIFDPNIGELIISLEEFKKMYLNKALIIKEVQKIKYKEKRNILNKNCLILYSLSLLIDYCLLYLISFFIKGDTYHVFYSFISLGGIAINIYAKVALVSYQSKLYDEQVESFINKTIDKEYHITSNYMKKIVELRGLIISLPYKILNSIFIILMICSILLNNGIYNLIIILLVLLVSYIISSFVKYKKNYYSLKIASIESKFIYNSNINESRTYYDKLTRLSKKMTNNLLNLKIIPEIIIFAIIITVNSIFNFNSLAYIIIFIGYYLILFNQFNYLFLELENEIMNFQKLKNVFFDLEASI